MKILLSHEQLAEGVGRLAEDINHFYGHRPVTLIGILTGSLIFMADLMRQLKMPLHLGLIQASSYEGATTDRGPLEINVELVPDITGHDVLLVDDIFDTGHTMVQVSEKIKNLGPTSVHSVVLLNKQQRREVDASPDWIGFEIPDLFVIGYGLDYDGLYRNLPYIAQYEEHLL